MQREVLGRGPATARAPRGETSLGCRATTTTDFVGVSMLGECAERCARHTHYSETRTAPTDSYTSGLIRSLPYMTSLRSG